MSADALLAVETIAVPREAVSAVVDHLKACGRYGFEGVAFWAGRLQGERRFLVNEAIVPRQHAVADMESGVGVVVGGHELFRLGVRLHKARMQLIAQIHSHPGSAYHSSTDDEMSIMTRVGTLSIVVPDFASRGLTLSTMAVHRLARDGRWICLDVKEATRLLQLGGA